MKILVVSQNHVSSYVGGNEVYADSLATELSKRGHTIDYLTHIGKKSSDYPLHIIKGFSVGKFILPTISWFKKVTEIKPELVHASGSGVSITALGLFCKIMKIKSVLTFQAPQINVLGKVDEFFQVHLFDRIIVTSTMNAQYLQKKTNTPVETVFLSLKHSFVVDKRISKQSARKRLDLSEMTQYVLMVAKLDEHHYYKGVQIALDSMIRLPKKYTLIILGSGPLLQTFKKKVTEMGIQKRVIFKNTVSDKSLPLYYQAADVFILPSNSTSEGFGLVLLESMACKTPVITTSCVGIAPYLKRNKLAKVIDPKNPIDLADAIMSPLIDTHQLNRASVFAWSRMVGRMCLETETVYKKVIRNK